MYYENDIISAISTPFGRGGIAVIRISGAGSGELAEKIFSPASGKKLRDYQPNRAVYGSIRSEGHIIDDGVAVYFRAPRSFTGEDTVEISCHGGIFLAKTVLEASFRAGARPANAGEFTQRAFMNGKLSLTQAEAVIDSIDAENEEQLRLSRSAVSGVISREVSDIFEKLMTVISEIAVDIDYPGEDLSGTDDDQLTSDIESVAARLEKLKKSYNTGKAIARGIDAVICGKPNVGKSSLLNRLLGEDRAIVTDAAGTTRDTLEETVTIGKVMFRLTDTAGIRESSDDIENEGIRRAKEKLGKAGLVIAVFDLSREPDKDDADLIASLDPAKTAAVFNKCDSVLECSPDIRSTVALYGEFAHTLTVSTLTGEGIDELKNTLEKMFVDSEIDYSTQAIISNARQYAAVCAAYDHTANALEALRSGMFRDAVSLDLESAASALGELDGRNISEQTVEMIFHRFCVGK